MYLLDTHVLIWTILNSSILSDKAVKIIKDSKNDICISSISFWEISLKVRINKFVLEGMEITEIPQFAKQLGFSVINLEQDEAISFCDLPLQENHKDPFDRMLIWQSIKRNIPLISKDKQFAQYKNDGLKLVW
jgi:PIN domain nuclease of toxin-antitoxin system